LCQEQLLLVGDEELVPTARVLASASTADGTAVGAATQVAQALLDAWDQDHSA
jgi:hypothetical protein